MRFIPGSPALRVAAVAAPACVAACVISLNVVHGWGPWHRYVDMSHYVFNAANAEPIALQDGESYHWSLMMANCGGGINFQLDTTQHDLAHLILLAGITVPRPLVTADGNFTVGPHSAGDYSLSSADPEMADNSRCRADLTLTRR
ncbi:MAG: hypothetical protein JWL78_1272 [Chloroflexi bacterium]|jgi:hypothetical protein|nr:hypothetical protein [Chloroflexota bacterium]